MAWPWVTLRFAPAPLCWSMIALGWWEHPHLPSARALGPLLAGAKGAGEPASAGEDRFVFSLSPFDWQKFFGSEDGQAEPGSRIGIILCLAFLDCHAAKGRLAMTMIESSL